MAKVTRVEGIDQVMGNLSREIGAIKGRTRAGLFAAGLIIQAESQRRTPVDSGNDRGSAYTRDNSALQRLDETGIDADRNVPVAPGGLPDLTVEVGHSAAYAIFVHENMEASHREGEAKHLENAAREKASEAVRAVAAYARGN